MGKLHLRFTTPLSIPIVALAISAGLAYGIVLAPALAVLPLVILLAAGIIHSALFRLGTVVYGGILVLQSSQELTAQKFLYCFAVLLAVAVAITKLVGFHTTPWAEILKPLMLVSCLWTFVVLVSLVPATMNDTPISLWFRDVIPYGLLIVVPIMANDVLAEVRSPKRVQSFYFVAAVIGAFSFSITWIERRHLIEAPLGQVLLSSFLLSASVFCLSISAAFLRPHERYRWILLATAVLILMLITGSRSSLLVLAVPVFLSLTGKKKLQSAAKLFAVGIAVSLVILAFAQLLKSLNLNNFSDPFARVRTISQLSSGPDLAAGQSLADRRAQTQTAWNAFIESPVFGKGPGFTYQWETPFSGIERETFLDSPLAIVAEFGVFGLLAMLASILLGIRFAKMLWPTRATHVWPLAVTAFLLLILIVLALYNPIEDKGMSLALMMMIPIAISQSIYWNGKPLGAA